MTLSVVIPCYNSEASLPILIPRVQGAIGPLTDKYEVVLVDDGSRDGTWDAIQRLTERFEYVRGIRLMRNYGQHSALLCGIRAARYHFIVTIDDDLQNPPEEIPRLLQKLSEGYDVVYGTPKQERHGLWRDAASIITKIALQDIMGAATARNVSAFRAFRTELRLAFARYHAPFVSIDVLLTWATTRFTAVRVRNEPRQIGASNYTFGKLLVHALNMMTGFSTLPLQVATVVGIVCAFFGLGVLAYVLIRYWIQGGSVPGFPFLASLVSIFSGAQLFALGIIGEYIGRMHFRTMDRPPYATREQIDGHNWKQNSTSTLDETDRRI